MATTTIDQALVDRGKRVSAAKEMKESLLTRNRVIEGDHVFDIERKKMPEDTHNKV